ncbi:MAG: hypothetical protein U9R25_19415 [Chloroflexota bacterium]|nr:hypothetical protein [Chloroflexota bacterium]
MSSAEKVEQGSFVALRVWLSGSPWRPTGAWLVLAGVLVVSGLRVRDWAVVPVFLALLLAELLWGALWSQLVTEADWTGNLGTGRPRLPFAQSDSVAGRLLGWNYSGSLSALLRGGLPLLILAICAAWPLGQPALIMTMAVTLLVGVGILAQRAGLRSWLAWLQATVQVGLPFLLGVSLAGTWPEAGRFAQIGVMALGFILLARAGFGAAMEAEVPSNAQGFITPLLVIAGLGSLLVIGVLLVAGQAIAAGVVALIAAAPLLQLARQGPVNAGTLWAWWWALTMAAAIAFSLEIG